MFDLFKIFKKKPDVPHLIGWVDHKFVVGKVTDNTQQVEFKVRSLLFVKDSGQRVVGYGIDAVLEDITPSHRHKIWSFKPMAELKAWENGGPLPDGFIPAKISERKPTKLPEQIRHDYNNR